MKKKKCFFVFLVIVALAISGCAGKMYVKETILGNGQMLVQGGRTGVFGTDNHFVYVPPSAPAFYPESQPLARAEKVFLERTYQKSSTSWTGCPDQKPNRNARNVKREEFKEKWTEETLPEQPRPVQRPIEYPIFMGWGNPSTGNLAIPTAVGAAGFVWGMKEGMKERRPDQTSISQSGGGANANATGGAGGAGGGANANSSSAADSASNSSAWQQQQQQEQQFSNIDIEID